MVKSKYSRKFIDSLRLYLKGGTGGPGHPKYGGTGGKGGNIYVQGNVNQTLLKTKKMKHDKRWVAENGKPSKVFRIFADSGKDLIIPSPLGTSIETDTGQKLGDILDEGDKILAAQGGSGGNPNNHFIGQKGEIRHIQIILKLIADIGLVGFPNAGKSTFLRAISHAKPKVASYPFTTLHPMIGIMQYDDLRKISVADLPGLIEGAWCNTGMGHKFLRHIERTKLLLFVVDIEGFRLGPEFPSRSPLETIILLNKELELYQEELLEKPSILLLNKMDKPNSKEKYDAMRENIEKLEEISMSMPPELRPEKVVKFGEVLHCSAKYDKESVENVKKRLRKLIDIYELDKDEKDDSFTEVHDRIKDKMYETRLKLL